MSETTRQTHRVEIEGVERDLPLFEVAPGLKIAVFNLLGDTEVVEAAAAGLARRLADVNADAIVTAETKSVPLVYELDHALRPLSHRYLGDPEKVKAAQAAVAAQGKAR